MKPEDAANIYLSPTILALAQVRPLRRPDGVSLLPLLQHGREILRDLRLETTPNDVYPVSYRAIRTTGYLYAEYDSGDRELYDLRRDPDELTNQAGDSRFRGLEAELHDRLLALEQCAGVSCCEAISEGEGSERIGACWTCSRGCDKSQRYTCYGTFESSVA